MRMEKCLIIFTCMLGMTTSLSNKKCRTPNYKDGYCTDIKLCPKLLNLLISQRKDSSYIAFIQKSYCGLKGDIAEVCCPLSNIKTSVTPKTAIPEKPFDLSSKSNWKKTNVTHSQNNGSTTSKLECRTPLFKDGYCTDIKLCPKLLNLLISQKQNSSYVALIQKSYCGVEGNITKVCCPLNVTSPPNKPKSVYIPDINNQVPLESRCGITNVNHWKIIGQTKAELGAWPWMAALGFQAEYQNNRKVQWLCGGTLISRSHVLTAAHCIIEARHHKLTTVRLGELDLDPKVEDGADPIDVPVRNIKIHESYNPLEFTNDIALLELVKSVVFNEFIQPICLPFDPTMKNADMSKSMLFVAGWGTFNTNLFEPLRFQPRTPLREVQIPVTEISKCKKAYSVENVVIDDRVLCAGYPEGGDDSCWGDSGGPLMWPKGKKYFLMGIVSYGSKICGKPGYPSVYTKVPSFMDWIVEKLNEN